MPLLNHDGFQGVFICESLAAKDFYKGRLDGYAANEVLKIQAVRTAYKVTMTKALLKAAIIEACDGGYEILHLSCHGDDEGVRLTDGTDIDWLTFASMLRRFANQKRILVMSCCSGGYVGLSKALVRENAVFGFLFGSTSKDGVGFAESCLAWSILYHDLLTGDGREPPKLRRTLDIINDAVGGDFAYRRWDNGLYRSYPNFRDR